MTGVSGAGVWYERLMAELWRIIYGVVLVEMKGLLGDCVGVEGCEDSLRVIISFSIFSVSSVMVKRG